LHRANEEIAQPLTDRIDAALTTEYEQQRPGWEDWVSRLSNAFGPFRDEVYEEWKAART
jgi:hypothetical protein